MEEKQIKAICDWPEPQSVRDIQVFLGSANFYRRFIKGFSRLTAPLTSMLKTTSVVGSTALAVVGDEEQDGKGIQVDGSKKEPVQKSRKG